MKRGTVAIALLLMLLAAPAAQAQKKKPDLQVAKVGSVPAQVAPGGSFTVAVTVRNAGKAAAKASTARARLSEQVALQPDAKTPRLKPRKSAALTLAVSVPTSTPPGAYKLTVCADAGLNVKESKETNNCRTGGDVTVLAGPQTVAPDTTAPPAPQASTTDPASPSRTQTRPVLRGVAEPGSAVSLFTGLSCAGSPVAGGLTGSDGTWAIEAPAAPNATTIFFASARDVAGNASPCSLAGLTYTHDGVPPVEPALTSTSPASPSANGTPTVSGTAEPGALVRLFLTTTCSGDPAAAATTTAAGAFSAPVPVPPNAVSEIRAVALDAAGNASACSAALTYTEDSLAPAPPVVASTTPASPSASNTQPTVSGTGTPGSLVSVFINPGCSGPVAASTTVNQAGGWSTPVNVPPNAASTLSANQADAAANASACSNDLPYAHDSQAPDAPVVTGFSPAPPSSDATPNVIGTAASGSTVRIYTVANCSGTPRGTGSAAQFGAGGITSTAIPNNTQQNFYASAIDAAGNVSPCSAGQQYLHDDLAPGAVTLTGTNPASPASHGNPQVTGSNAQPGATLEFFTDNTCSGTPAASATATGTSFSVAVSVAADTTAQIRARQRDAAGNVSGCSSALPYVRDTLAPDIPVITEPAGATSSTDSTPTLHGTAEPNSSVLMHFNSPCVSGGVANIPVDAEGAWVHTPTVPANTQTQIYVRAMDAADNISGCSAPTPYTHDSVAPAAPTLLTSIDNNTSENRPLLKGGASGDAQRVEIFATPSCSGNAIAEATPAQFAGAGVRPAAPLPNGAILLSARSVDAAGNNSPCSGALTQTEKRPSVITPEVESNNSSAQAAARTLRITEDHVMSGQFDATNAHDMFRLALPGPQLMRFESFAGTAGAQDCPAGTDSTVTVRVADVQVASDSDSGIGACGSITRFFDALTFGSAIDATTFGTGADGYTLEARTLRSEGQEIENNNVNATVFLDGTDNYVVGVANGSGDPDTFVLFVPHGSSLRLELISRPGQTPGCENTAHMSIAVLGVATVSGDTHPNHCALLDGTGAAPLTPAAHALASNQYLVRVATTSASAQPYLLAYTVRTP